MQLFSTKKENSEEVGLLKTRVDLILNILYQIYFTIFETMATVDLKSKYLSGKHDTLNEDVKGGSTVIKTWSEGTKKHQIQNIYYYKKWIYLQEEVFDKKMKVIEKAEYLSV